MVGDATEMISNSFENFMAVGVLLEISVGCSWLFLICFMMRRWPVSSNEKNPDDNSAGQFRTKRNMYFYELGFGIDFYLHYFKFTPSIRGVFAINDELVRDEDPNSPWTGNVTSMKTRGIFINFTFQ